MTLPSTDTARVWVDRDLEDARERAARAVGSATRCACAMTDALHRDPNLQAVLGPLIEPLFAAARTARTAEHELAALQSDRRRRR